MDPVGIFIVSSEYWLKIGRQGKGTDTSQISFRSFPVYFGMENNLGTLGHIKKIGDCPRPCLKNGPDPICFLSFFHILMQSEKYIFENN
jgi:hypothetical protein